MIAKWITKNFKTICLVLMIFSIVTIVWAMLRQITIYGSEQQEQVEVVKKRTRITFTGGSRNRHPNCYVTFKFSDGFEHEYYVTYREYNSILENEIGILTYRALKNIDSEKPYRGYFIGFEKDSSYR